MKINSGQAPSTLVPKYIGSDFDHVVTVGKNIEDVKTVAGAADDMEVVIDNLGSVTTVATNIGDVVSVSDNMDYVRDVAGAVEDVGVVVDNLGSVTTVATNIGDVVSVSDNMDYVKDVAAGIVGLPVISYIGEEPPTQPEVGSSWYCTADGRTYVWYKDVDSYQWVESSPQSAPLDLQDVREVAIANTERQMKLLGYDLVKGSFEAGALLSKSTDVVLYKETGVVYKWKGVFPAQITANSSPTGTGISNWEEVVAPVMEASVLEALRRSYAEAGYNLVDGSFEAGGTLVNTNDVLLQERTGKAFSGPAGTVPAGTDPASGGGIGPAAWVDQSGNILRNTINGFFKSGRWDAVKHLTESRMLVSDNAGLFWEWMGSFPKIITTEPSTADSWKCHGLCNGFDLTDSRNWVPTGATPEVTHKNLQLCLDTYKTIHLMALYGGSKALVVDSATSFTGVNRDMCGYTNIYCNRETLGSVLAPEMGGLTDDYNVIADLIVKPGDNQYAAYLKWDNVSFGLSGRVPLPEYNIYAPRCVATVMGRVKTYRASIANIFSRCWYSSIFATSLARGGGAVYGWKFGEDSFTKTAPVGMTSNTFLSCGANGANIGWLLQNCTYSSFNGCHAEGSPSRAVDTDAAFKVINPSGLVFSACGSESLQTKSFVIRSNANYYNRYHCSITEYSNGYGTTYSGAWFDIDGLVDVRIHDAKLLPAAPVDIFVKTTGSCKVTISGNIPFSQSTTDSTGAIKFADYIVSASGKPANGEILPNDGILFKSGVAQFKMRMMLDAMVSTRNFSASAANLDIARKGFVLIGFPQTIPAGAFGTALSKTIQTFSFGDDATVAAGGATFSSKFDFPSGQGGVSCSYQSV